MRTATPDEARTALLSAVEELRAAMDCPARRPEGVGALSRARLVAQRAGVAGMDVEAAWKAAMRGDLAAAVEFTGYAIEAVDVGSDAA